MIFCQMGHFWPKTKEILDEPWKVHVAVQYKSEVHGTLLILVFQSGLDAELYVIATLCRGGTSVTFCSTKLLLVSSLFVFLRL